MLKIYVPKVLSGEIGDWCSSISLAAGVPICWGTDQLGHFVNAPSADWVTSLSAAIADACEGSSPSLN